LGAAEGYTVVAAARDAERSLKRGDLEGFVSAARDVPASLAGLLLEDDASRLARQLGTGHPSGPMAECLLELEQGGVPAAVLHAARYLERDGLAAHPDLAAIVLHGLRTHSGPSRPEKITSLGVVARLFFERPDLSPEELRLSGPFRSLLLRFVLEHDDPSTSGFALTGLSGCGTPRQIPALLRWLEPLVEVGKRDSRELARLTLNCMTRIIRRSEGCGFTGQPHETDLGHVLRNAKRILAPLDERGQMGLSLERLFVAVASATRATGSGPSLDELLREFEPESRLARAAMLDPHVLAELRHWSRRMHGSYGMYKTYGMLVGMYDSTALASRLEQQVRIASSASRMLRRRCLSFYRAGLEWAHRQLVGLKRGEDLDSNTRLGAYLAELGSPVQIQDLVEDLSIGSKEAVKWNFEGPRVRAQGRKLELSTRCVTFEQDPLKEEDGYARLGVFGRSELRFRFHSAPKHDGALQLELYLQNGLRPLLPHNGQSSISILLDGVLVHERVPILGHSPRASLFSLSPATEERDHEIVVRLHETSNTTLRLYWARVFYW
ncbi:MAG: hypothetical protein ACE5F1_19280, partial [Planctomycetota bacterium]